MHTHFVCAHTCKCVVAKTVKADATPLVKQPGLLNRPAPKKSTVNRGAEETLPHPCERVTGLPLRSLPFASAYQTGLFLLFEAHHEQSRFKRQIAEKAAERFSHAVWN